MSQPSGKNADAPTTLPVASAAVVIAAVGAMAAAWLAAGSAGLLAHPLRHTLAWLCLLATTVAAWPRASRTPRTLGMLSAALVVGLLLSITAQPVPNVMAVALVVAALAWAQAGLAQRVLLIVAAAVAVLGVYRLALLTIPTVWLAADAIGFGLGRLGGSLSGRPLWLGATFGGVDLLVLMFAFYSLWLAASPRPRLGRAIRAAAAIVVAQLAYLFVLSLAADIISALPEPPEPPPSYTTVPPPWHWSPAVRSLVPWNLPAVGVLLQLLVAAAMLRWTTWSSEAGTASSRGKTADSPAMQIALDVGPALLAVVVPLLTVLAPGTSDLSGRKIVAYQKGQLDPPEAIWTKPAEGQSGRTATDRYGMLPELVASLGGSFTVSPELDEADLEEADLLVLLHPAHPWTDEQLARIDRFVRDGGSLLVAAGSRVQEGKLASRFNDVLDETAMRVRFDSAIYETDQWRDALEPIAHPATVGLGDANNALGLAAGSSIELAWPARPVVAGSFGWSDPGCDFALTGLSRYDSGEKLGDLVLGAEQRWGSGTIFVLGDTSPFANDSLPRSYRFVARLLGHLAGHGAGPQAMWRQVLGLLGCVLLVGLLMVRPEPGRVAIAAGVLGVSIGLCILFGSDAAKTIPNGRREKGLNKLLYVDTSHMEAFDESGWSEGGINGWLFTLMQNGYLPLELPELSADRLDRAGVLVLIAPRRALSSGQREIVGQFVEKGGRLICMAGATDAAPLRPLLDQFDVKIPHSPVGPNDPAREPEPFAETPDGSDESFDKFGKLPAEFLKVDYGSISYTFFVFVSAGWPVICEADRTEVVIHGTGDTTLGVARGVGSGIVVVIGDSGFVSNGNMGYDNGRAVGVENNARFWLWMLSRVHGPSEWLPPEPKPEETEETPDEEPAVDMPAVKPGESSAEDSSEKPAAKPAAGPRLEPPESLFRAVPGKEASP